MENMRENAGDSPKQTQVLPDEPGDGGLSVRGLFEVFYSPSRLFTALKKRPKVLVPYLALAVLTVVFMAGILDLMWQYVSTRPEFLERFPGGDVPAQAEPFIKWSMAGAGIVAMILSPLLAASVTMFFGSVVMAGRARFKQLLSVVLYGEIIYAVGQLVHMALMLAKGSMEVSLSLGILVIDQGMQSTPFVALSKFSLFFIWEIIVAGIGFSIIYGFPRNKGILLAVLSLGLLSALHVIMTAAGLQ